ncbi:hypothetical protein AAG906_038292 [Vitis piasezkii]
MGNQFRLDQEKRPSKNASTLGYFNSAQAIADFAEVLIYIKKKLLAENSPVIVVGVLASWYRLKYPHVAVGALASSATILDFDDITPKMDTIPLSPRISGKLVRVATKLYVNHGLKSIELLLSPMAFQSLAKNSELAQLINFDELKDYLETAYSIAAQYNEPRMYLVTKVCGGIDGAPEGSDILSRIFADVVAFRGNKSCYYTNTTDYSIETIEGWKWQDIKLILYEFASNIISNGLRDPYSSGGVLENISHTVLAIHTVNGSHCLDIPPAKSTDPEWLVMQRKTEIEIIENWIAKYCADLDATRNGPSSNIN